MRWSETLGAVCLLALCADASVAEARGGRAAEIVGEALDYVKEAADLNEDEDSRCQGKLAGRLGGIEERLKELRHEPMPRGAFQGFLAGLQSNANEILRKDQCQDLLPNHYISAQQLGQLMDLFVNEILRLDVARAAAPRVVDPMNALGFSGKFHNSILARDFTSLMSKERR